MSGITAKNWHFAVRQNEYKLRSKNIKNVFKSVINYFKEWNWFELCFIFTFEIVFIVLGIVYKQSFMSCLYSITILICAFLLAKGKWYGYIFGVFGMLAYCYMSFLEHYWAEAVWHLVVTIPIYLISIFSWFRHQQNKVVKIRKITKLEVTLFVLGLVIMCAAIWIVLWAVNSPLAWSSAFAITFSFASNYLAMRRSNAAFVVWCLDDVFVIVLWLIPVINGEIALLNVAITTFAFLINDIYGVINWRRMNKQQQFQDAAAAQLTATAEQTPSQLEP